MMIFRYININIIIFHHQVAATVMLLVMMMMMMMMVVMMRIMIYNGSVCRSREGGAA